MVRFLLVRAGSARSGGALMLAFLSLNSWESLLHPAEGVRAGGDPSREAGRLAPSWAGATCPGRESLPECGRPVRMPGLPTCGRVVRTPASSPPLSAACASARSSVRGAEVLDPVGG